MNKKVKMIVCVVLVSTVILGGMSIVKFKNGDKNNSANAMNIEKIEERVPVIVVKAESGNIMDEIYTIGQAAPSSSYDVNAKTSGEVNQVYFEIGEEVSRGDILFSMDMDLFDIEKNKNLIQLSNQVEQTKLSYDDAKKTYDDKKEIFDEGAVSQYDLDHSLISFENAKIAYENALKNQDSMKATYVEQDENYMIKSPVDGIITSRTVEPGMFVSAQNGFTVIVKDEMVIEASVASKYVNNVELGQKTKIYVNTLDRTYDGEVASISYTAKKGSYPVEITINDVDGRIQSGMFVELSIETEYKEGVVLLPKDSIISEGSVDYIYTIDDSDIAHKVIVETGISNNGMIEVMGEINAGTQVVTEGKEYLDEGKLVMV